MVLVVGDVMLDQFLIGSVTRISPEAPVPIVHFDHAENRIGGAANVAHNVVALGARAEIVGLVGTDAEAAMLREALAARHVGTTGLVTDAARPTTRKVRVVTDRHQQVARLDYERDHEAPQDVETELIARARSLAATAGAGVIGVVRLPRYPPKSDRERKRRGSESGSPSRAAWYVRAESYVM